MLVLPCPQHAHCERFPRLDRHLRRRLGGVQFYRFGTGTAEFVICRNCGVYIGAIEETAGDTRAVINTTCLDHCALFTRDPAPTDHDGETMESRLARRAAKLAAGDNPPLIHLPEFPGNACAPVEKAGKWHKPPSPSAEPLK